MFVSTTINYRLVPFFGPNRERKHNTNTIRSFVCSFQPYDRLLGRSIDRWFIHSVVRSFVCLFVAPFRSLIFNYRYNIYYIYIEAKATDRFESGQWLFHVMTWLSAWSFMISLLLQVKQWKPHSFNWAQRAIATAFIAGVRDAQRFKIMTTENTHFYPSKMTNSHDKFRMIHAVEKFCYYSFIGLKNGNESTHTRT